MLDWYLDHRITLEIKTISEIIIHENRDRLKFFNRLELQKRVKNEARGDIFSDVFVKLKNIAL